jgi:membrane protein YqaA with SNARE-associated domain
MNARDFLDLLAVVIATAITAFVIVAAWSLLGGLVTYIIALLLGGALIHCWSNDHENVSRDTDV